MERQEDIAIAISKDAFKVLDEFNKIGKLKNEGKITEQDYRKRVYVEILKSAQLKLVTEQAMKDGAEFNDDQLAFLTDLFTSLSEEADIMDMDELKKEDVMAVRNFVRKYDHIVSSEDLEEDLSCFD